MGGVNIPSSNKTKTIGLNYWIGEDKPKRSDFNSDNLVIEREITKICELLEQSLLVNKYVATIRHELGYIPIGSLYLTEYAAGISYAGEGPGGGGDVMEIPLRLRLVDSQTVDIFTTALFEDTPEIIKTSNSVYNIVFPNSAKSLILILR